MGGHDGREAIRSADCRDGPPRVFGHLFGVDSVAREDVDAFTVQAVGPRAQRRLPGRQPQLVVGHLNPLGVGGITQIDDERAGGVVPPQDRLPVGGQAALDEQCRQVELGVTVDEQHDAVAGRYDRSHP